MRTLIVGATGWIGGAIAEAAQAAGHETVGLARSLDAEARLRAVGVEPVRGDAADAATLVAPVQEADVVVYAASIPADATTTALERIAGVLAGANKPFLFISGSSIYGDTGDDGPADEDARLHTPAAVTSLVRHEEIVRTTAHGLVVRGAGILYGRGGGATPKFWLEDARRRGVARYIGDGSQRWSAVHVDDLAALVVAAIARAPAGSVFNAVAEALPLREAADVVARATGLPGGATSVSETAVRDEWGTFWSHLLARDLWLSGERAQRVLGWWPTAPGFVDDLLHGSYRDAA